MAHKKNTADISVEQAKLLGSALRVQIMKQVLDEPKTSKQVATLLGQSPGNVHYHMKKLHDGGLLKLVEERPFGGVVEKYYQAVASRFYSPENALDPALGEDFKSINSTIMSIRLNLTPEEKSEMNEAFLNFLEDWVEKTSGDNLNKQEYSVGVKIVSIEQKGENE